MNKLLPIVSFLLLISFEFLPLQGQIPRNAVSSTVYGETFGIGLSYERVLFQVPKGGMAARASVGLSPFRSFGGELLYFAAGYTMGNIELGLHYRGAWGMQPANAEDTRSRSFPRSHVASVSVGVFLVRGPESGLIQ